MARGKKQIDGQLCFDFCIDSKNYVCQANDLIGGKQSLKLNSAKLIRAAIMQVVKEDEELKPYIISIKDLSKLLGVPSSNIYRDIENITDDIIKNPVYVREEHNGKTINFIKIPWVTRCEYKSDVGVALKLNEELRPFLVNLRKHYTQYVIDDILVMKSAYSIRLYELLQSKIMTKILPKNGIDIELSIKMIKECCGCEGNKAYNVFSNFRNRVIDVSVKEINEKTMYKLNYEYVKKSRSVIGLIFHINAKYH